MLQLVLRIATPEQYHRTLVNTHPEWGPLLTLEQYVKLEQTLLAEPFSHGGNAHTCWVLVPAGDPLTLELFAHCETYKRPVLTADGNGNVEEKECYSVASVFVPPERRGGGYAKHMLRLLIETLSQYGAICSALYSDIGPSFYANLGWKNVGGSEVVFPAPSSPPLESSSLIIENLTLADLSSITDTDISLLRHELSTLPLNSFAIVPTRDAYTWLIAKAQYYAITLSRTLPTFIGASISGTSDFIVWFPEYRENKLYILRLRTSSPEATRTLLLSAFSAARDSGTSNIVAWDPKKEMFNDALLKEFGGAFKEREYSLSGVKWFGESEGQGEWLINEKFGWV